MTFVLTSGLALFEYDVGQNLGEFLSSHKCFYRTGLAFDVDCWIKREKRGSLDMSVF